MTQITVPPGVDADAADYFARLRALQIGHEEGWYAYLAGDNNPGRYLVELFDGPRFLDRDAYWWVLGAADRYGHGNLVLAPAEVPDLVTLEQAADVFGLTVVGVRNRINRGLLYVAYPGGRRRLVRAQVLAQAGNESARAEWARLSALWPPTTRIHDIDPPVETPPTPVITTPTAAHRIQVLTAASEAGLIRYLWVDPTTDIHAASITVDGDTTVRQLYGPTVIPWVRGVADMAGRSDILHGLV